MRNVLYAIPHFECCLSCSYCTLKDKHIEYNEEAFIKGINDFYGDIILFGGEPLLYKDRFLRIVDTGKINSVTTSLYVVDEDVISLIREKGIGLSTSWTPERYDKKKTEVWLDNLRKSHSFGYFDISLLITMSPKVLDLSVDEFYTLFSKIEETKAVSSILFEYVIDENNTKNYYDSVDKWLYKITTKWPKNSKIENRILGQLEAGWYFDCSRIYTLTPNGVFHNVCPNGLDFRITPNMECLTCLKNENCRPCRLQKYCNRPKSLEG